MLAIFRHYMIGYNGLPLLFYFFTAGVLWDTYVDELTGPPSGLAVVYLYGGMFFKHNLYKDFKSLDIGLPISYNKLWFSKIITFYSYIVIYGLLNTAIAYFQGESLFEAYNDILLGTYSAQALVLIASRWDIFKSRNLKYIFTSIAVVVFTFLLMIEYVDGRQYFKSQYGTEEIQSYYFMLNMSCIVILSIVEYLIGRMKK